MPVFGSSGTSSPDCPFRNSLMPRPRAEPISGSLPAPNMMSIIKSIIISSVGPILGILYILLLGFYDRLA